jgi:Ferritin-like
VRYSKAHVATTPGSKRTIVELLQVEEAARDCDWLTEMLQNAVELELATLPVYLSGLWSINPPSGPVYTLVNSVIMEEMLHLGLASNMLVAIGGSPRMLVHPYPGPLPGGVRPDLKEVYLAGLSHDSVGMYMQIEYPEHLLALADEETYPTIGAFYDAVLARFQTVNPTISTDRQQAYTLFVPNPSGSGPYLQEQLTVLHTLADVEAAIILIKDQGEGTGTSPDAPQFGGPGGELAHYYRFGEIFNGKQFIQEPDGHWDYVGDPVPFPACYSVPKVPKAGYPDMPAVQTFDAQFAALLTALEQVWAGESGTTLGDCVGLMGKLASLAAPIVSTPLPGGGGNYGPDFKVGSTPTPPS